jgi:hypothetical protein
MYETAGNWIRMEEVHVAACYVPTYYKARVVISIVGYSVKNRHSQSP